jgi:hypothetical protein
MTTRMVSGYLLVGAGLVVGLILSVNYLLGSIPLLRVESPRLILRNPFVLLLLGVGYSLVFGGVGIAAGVLLWETYRRVKMEIGAILNE